MKSERLSLKKKKSNGKLEWKSYFGWESLSTLSKYYSKHVQGNFHIKAHLRILVPLFTDCFTKSVKRKMCLNLKILNTFFFSQKTSSDRAQCYLKGFLIKINIYQKANWHSLIPPFAESVTQFVNRRICPHVEILNTFFVGNLIGSWIMLFKRFSKR